MQNTWIVDADILGSDMNKLYKDSCALDYAEKTFDPSKPYSFSHEFFLAQSGNKQATAAEALLNLSNYMPQSGSPLLNAAAFTASALNGFEPVAYVGAFDGTNDWTKGWTNFDPQNTDY